MKNSRLIQSIVIIAAFVLGYYVKRILPESITSIVYTPVWWALTAVIASGILYGWRNILESLALHKKLGQSLGLAFLMTLPMLIGYAIIGNVNTDLTMKKMLYGAVFAAFFEELMFRGFLFGQLFRYPKWGFIPAVIINAVIFGAAHLYQGNGFGEILGIFAVTLLGGVWFAWLYIEWESLWLPMGLHFLMNLYWMIFDISATALGGWGANLFRVGTIALSIYLTIRHAKKRGHFNVNRNNLLWQRVSEP